MFRVRRLSKDVSNLSIKNLLNENPPCGLFDVYMTYPVIRFSPLCRIGGAVPDFVLLVDSITPVLFTMRRLRYRCLWGFAYPSACEWTVYLLPRERQAHIPTQSSRRAFYSNPSFRDEEEGLLRFQGSDVNSKSWKSCELGLPPNSTLGGATAITPVGLLSGSEERKVLGELLEPFREGRFRSFDLRKKAIFARMY